MASTPRSNGRIGRELEPIPGSGRSSAGSPSWAGLATLAADVTDAPLPPIYVARAPVRILASADGEPVALHDFGGPGPALLLGHGNGLNAGMWAAALPHLVGLGFHCYGLDLRGHGACRPTRVDYDTSRRRFAEDVLAAVDGIGGGPVAYAGHSLSGASGVLAALLRPAAFAALWVYEPVLTPAGAVRSGDDPALLAAATRKRRTEFASVDDAFGRLTSKPPFDRCDPAAVRGYLEIGTRPVDGRVRLTCRAEDEARVFGSVEALDFTRLAGLTVPVTVAYGAAAPPDVPGPGALAPLVAEALDNARLERHEHLTHFGPMEDGAAMARSIATAVTPAG